MHNIKLHTIEVEGLEGTARAAYATWLEENISNLAEIPQVTYIDISETVTEEVPNSRYDEQMELYKKNLEWYNKKMSELTEKTKQKAGQFKLFSADEGTPSFNVHRLPGIPKEPSKTRMINVFNPEFKVCIIYKTI